MKAALIFYPNSAKMDQKSKLTPIYMRVCLNRLKSECRLNAELNEKEISRWDSVTMRIQERSSQTNSYLNVFELRFREWLIQNPNLKGKNAREIKEYLIGKTEQRDKELAIEYIEEFYTKTILSDINRKESTIKVYRRAINHLKRFLYNERKLGIKVCEFDYETASNFKNYLLNSDPGIDRIGMTEASAATVIKKFRTIFSEAEERDLIKKNPFKQVKIKPKSPRRDRLSLEQVSKLHNLKLEQWPRLKLYRDIFLFSVYTGLAYYDAMSLSWRNLEQRKDGNLKLTVSRIKTEVITESFLPGPAIEIAKTYIKTIEPNYMDYVLPTRSNKEVNEQLKKLAYISAIPVKLTTHIARHTHRQLLAEAGIADIAVIKRMMGQTRNGDVDEIYYSVTEKSLLLAKEKFEILLNSGLNE